MRTLALITGYVIMTSIGAVALGTLLYLLRDELAARRTRRHYRERENGRSTPRTPQRPQEGGGTQDAPPSRGPLVRVGRPARSPLFQEQWTTTESLAQLLTYSGRLLLAAERERNAP